MYVCGSRGSRSGGSFQSSPASDSPGRYDAGVGCTNPRCTRTMPAAPRASFGRRVGTYVMSATHKRSGAATWKLGRSRTVGDGEPHAMLGAPGPAGLDDDGGADGAASRERNVAVTKLAERAHAPVRAHASASPCLPAQGRHDILTRLRIRPRGRAAEPCEFPLPGLCSF